MLRPSLARQRQPEATRTFPENAGVIESHVSQYMLHARPSGHAIMYEIRRRVMV